jgi:hypothetical protein
MGLCDKPVIATLIKLLLGAIKQFDSEQAYEYAEKIALATGNYDIKASLAKDMPLWVLPALVGATLEPTVFGEAALVTALVGSGYLAGQAVLEARHRDPTWNAPGNPGWDGWDWTFHGGQKNYKPPDKGWQKWVYYALKAVDLLNKFVAKK